MGGSGETSHYGATKNAGPQQGSGGSSSGSAAAVASGQVRLSPTATGGSIRQPAAFNRSQTNLRNSFTFRSHCLW